MRSVRFKERAPDKFAERLRRATRRARGRFEHVRVVRMPRPPYGGACESINSLRRRIYIDRLLPYTRFVKELRRKISRAGVLYPHTPKLLRDVINMLLYVT